MKARPLTGVVLGLVLLSPFSVMAAATQVPLWSLGAGMKGLSWSSDIGRTGHEIFFPMGLNFRTSDGRFAASFSTSAATGHYAWNAPGPGSYGATRMTDSTLGFAVKLPWETTTLSLAADARLPTGDADWELEQAPGNLPLDLEPTRYRGRGFGLDSLAVLERSWGRWSLGISGGYLFSAARNLPSLDQEVDLGSSALAGLMASQGRDVALRLFRTFPQDARIGGGPAFRAPPATLADLQFSTGGSVRFACGARAAFYGKAWRPSSAGAGLEEEAQGSFGTVLEATPSIHYSAGPRVEFQTGLLGRLVFANEYPISDPLYRGGGSAWGASQEAVWKATGSFSTRLQLGWRHLTETNGAQTAEGTPADASYDVIAFGTGVDLKW